MRVQRVVLPEGQGVSWTVLGADHTPIEPIESWLSHLSNIGRSPNTQKAYATDVRDYFLFLDQRRIGWREPSVEVLGEWTAWLRSPAGDGGTVVAIGSRRPRCGPATVSRKLSAVSAFYEFHARHGLDVGRLRPVWQAWDGRRAGGSWKPFLTDIGPSRQRRRQIPVRVPKREPRLRTAVEVQSLLDACERLRDRFLIALLYSTGIRIGEALGARHEDLVPRRGEFRVVARDNDNGARAKSGERTVPAPPELMRLYADYITEEYQTLDSDYVFVNLWSGRRGAPVTYTSAHDLACRLSRQVGFKFEFHQLRHSYATGLLRRGVPVEVVSKLLGHRHVTTTIDTYAHLSDTDIRRHLAAVGFFENQAVTL